MRTAALVLALLAFTGWSLWTVADDGLPGLFTLLETKPWGRQVFVDLCIALSVAWVFLRPEAQRLKVPLWPYLVATPFVGSISLLVFLIHRELRLNQVHKQAPPA
jgi:hypothetical protein